MKEDKRGTDKILSIYWFVVLTLVGGGVFAMVYIFYGTPYDVRGIEGELLAQKVADCVSRNGVIDSAFFVDNQFNEKIKEDISDRCNIIFKVEEGYNEEIGEQYFYKIEFYNVNDLVTSSFVISDGNLNWESECYIKKENSKEYKRLVRCTEKRFYAVDEENNQYLIKILSAIGKSEKNVKR